MKSRKSAKKARALANKQAREQMVRMHQFGDPSADQHIDLLADMDQVRTEQEQAGADDWVQASTLVENARRDGSALANHQDLAIGTPALPTNRIVSYPKMPSAHFDIKVDGTVETLVQPGTQEFTNATTTPAGWTGNWHEIPADFPAIQIPEPDFSDLIHESDYEDAGPEFETLMNGDGTVNKVLRKNPDYDWSLGVPQFVTDLEGAIDGFLKDQPALDRASTASEIAAELLRHPALHGYLDSGFVPDCEYQNHVELDDPEFAHLAQFERYAGNDVVRKGDQIGTTGNTGHYGVDWNGVHPEDGHFREWVEGGITMLPVESEQEFLGNDPEVVPGEGNTAGWERWDRRRPQLIAQAKTGIAALQELAGMAAEHKGFHEDRPDYGPELTNWQGNKLMLIVSEAVEAHDEIRSGKPAYETYYPTWDEGQSEEPIPGKHKPEGVPSEIADVVIRSADFAWTEGFDLADIIIEKLEFNATRGYKHGKQF